jgi:hypothetical protein
VTVSWFDDTTVGGGCAEPQSWQVLYRDGETWKPAKQTATAAPIPAKAGRGELSFESVRTTGLRIQAQLQAGKSGGLLEWQVME